MLARPLLLLSSLATLSCGLALIAGGMYCLANSNIASRLSAQLGPSSNPRIKALKDDIVTKFNESGIMKAIAQVLFMSGFTISIISALGVWASMTGSKIFVLLYLLAMALVTLGFMVMLSLMLGISSTMEQSILNRFTQLQDTKFVSVVAVFNNAAGDASFVTLMFNLLQFHLGCCGVRSVGDIRDSPRWRASPRGLAGLLDLRPGEKASIRSSLLHGNFLNVVNPGDSVSAVKDGSVPDWLRDRMPPGATLPTGLNLPEKIPDGVTIPFSFKITPDILHNASLIVAKFEDSLLLRTPVFCCKFKNGTWKLDAKALLANMVDQNCPFQSENIGGVQDKTCLKAFLAVIGRFGVPILFTCVAIILLMSCNALLAIQMLLCC